MTSKYSTKRVACIARLAVPDAGSNILLGLVRGPMLLLSVDALQEE